MMADIIIQDLRDFITELEQHQKIDVEAAKEGHSWSEDVKMMHRSRMRLREGIIRRLESIIAGRGNHD